MMPTVIDRQPSSFAVEQSSRTSRTARKSNNRTSDEGALVPHVRARSGDPQFRP